MPSVRTILGDVEADTLGITYFHEHAISQPPRHFPQWEQDLVLDDVDASSRELALFKAIGGTCIVDGTTIDYGRNAAALAEVARRSGCHVVGTAGYNKAAYFASDVEHADLDELQDAIARDASVGMDGTECRAGILKFGTSYGHMTAAEERAARAACRVQRATGLPLYTHTEAGTFALEQLELIADEGVDKALVCIGHLDRNPDIGYLRRVAAQGVFLGIDQIGKRKYASDDERIELVIALIEAGFRRRILVSGDMARRSYLTAYGGGPGLQHVARTFIPRLLDALRERGFTASEADRIGEHLLIENPRDFLCVQG